MNNKNPFDAPSAQPSGTTSSNGRTRSVLTSSIAGGFIGLILGVIGVVALFVIAPSVPGIPEILIIFAGVLIALVLPGLVIGAIIGAVINPSTRN